MAKKPKKSLDESVAEMDARRDLSSPEWFLSRLAADERRQKEGQKYKEESRRSESSYGGMASAEEAAASSETSGEPDTQLSSGPAYRKGGMVKKSKGGMVTKARRSSRGDGCATRGFTKGRMY